MVGLVVEGGWYGATACAVGASGGVATLRAQPVAAQHGAASPPGCAGRGTGAPGRRRMLVARGALASSMALAHGTGKAA